MRIKIFIQYVLDTQKFCHNKLKYSLLWQISPSEICISAPDVWDRTKFLTEKRLSFQVQCVNDGDLSPTLPHNYRSKNFTPARQSQSLKKYFDYFLYNTGLVAGSLYIFIWRYTFIYFMPAAISAGGGVGRNGERERSAGTTGTAGRAPPG